MTAEPENVEEILEVLGGFGRFQALAVFLLLWMEIPSALAVFLPVFIGNPPSQWLCGNESFFSSDICGCEDTLKAANPSHSIVSEWDLVCASSWVSDAITSAQLVGMLFGGLIISQLSDWYGRRYCFFGMSFLMSMGTVLTAIAPDQYVYLAARLFCGVGFSGLTSITAVYTVEFVTPKWRPLCTALSPFGVGLMLLGTLGYFIRPWRMLTWATLVPSAMMFVLLLFVPESPRWLLRNRKTTESYDVFKRIARVNGKEPIGVQIVEKLVKKDEAMSAECENRPTYSQFWKDKDLLKTTLCMQALWSTWGLVYFGISYNLRNLPGDPYLNMIYLGLTDAVGYPLSLFVSNRFGRRRSLFGAMTFAAIFLCTIAVLQTVLTDLHNQTYMLATLCFLGKFGVAVARPLLRTLTGESYPTALRAMGVCIASCPGFITAALAPPLAFLGSQWPSLPFFVFAFVSVIGSLVGFSLKETAGLPLEEQLATKKPMGSSEACVELQSVVNPCISFLYLVPHR